MQQYDMEGNLLKEYKSVKDAMRQTGTADKAIISVAKGQYKQWNGYVWRYKNR